MGRLVEMSEVMHLATAKYDRVANKALLTSVHFKYAPNPHGYALALCCRKLQVSDQPYCGWQRIASDARVLVTIAVQASLQAQ